MDPADRAQRRFPRRVPPHHPVEMDYLVIARKYRPQTFSDVAGQDVVARTLTNAIRSNRVAHAYLFTGPRGVGKTSMARIFAKALACEQGPTTEPCGVCQHCMMITNGSHPDVVEIDAARFNSVDDIRTLADQASFAPSLARMRLFILDEVHMLSNAAWNALLKVLEEPPAHLRFIFATTEVDRVLPTVLSRCQRFDFRSIALDDIVKRLRSIAETEGMALSEPVLYRLARAAGGGMRDAQTLLDQLIAVSENGVREEDLNLLLGAARGEDVEALVSALIAGQTAQALEHLESTSQAGVAPASLLDQVIDHLRGMLLLQACGRDSPALRRLGLLTETLERHAKDCPPEKSLRICQLLVGCQQALRHGVDPRLQLELTCVRISRLGQLAGIDDLLKRLERLESAGPPRP